MTKLDHENNYVYHPASPKQQESYGQLRSMAKGLAYLIDMHCPDSRERSLAHTNLEQAIMWANASIARSKPDAPGISYPGITPPPTGPTLTQQIADRITAAVNERLKPYADAIGNVSITIETKDAQVNPAGEILGMRVEGVETNEVQEGHEYIFKSEDGEEIRFTIRGDVLSEGGRTPEQKSFGKIIKRLLDKEFEKFGLEIKRLQELERQGEVEP